MTLLTLLSGARPDAEVGLLPLPIRIHTNPAEVSRPFAPLPVNIGVDPAATIAFGSPLPFILGIPVAEAPAVPTYEGTGGTVPYPERREARDWLKKRREQEELDEFVEYILPGVLNLLGDN